LKVLSSIDSLFSRGRKCNVIESFIPTKKVGVDQVALSIVGKNKLKQEIVK
jgi:hypothetical protein